MATGRVPDRRRPATCYNETLSTSRTSALRNVRARRNPAVDPARLRALSGGALEIWHRIGADGALVRDLARGVAADRLVSDLRTLQAMGAILLEEDPGSDDDIPIYDETELDEVSSPEAALLAEDVELEAWEKRRILAVRRAVAAGRMNELLNVPRNASRRQLKRAYFQLSKEYHPDRYYSRKVGGFGPILQEIFAALSQFVKTLSDARTVTGETPRPTEQRRKHTRYPFTAKVRLRCASWSRDQSAVTQDLSAGGVFVVCREAAAIGETVEIVVETSDATVPMRGTVVSLRSADEAERAKRRPGFGVRFDGADDRRIQMLLALARQMAPHAAAEGVPPPRRRLARGTGPIRHPEPILGIDLGTTNTSVSASLGNRVYVLPWPDGGASIPSVVAFPRRGETVIGADARRRQLRDPRHVVASAKRLLGRRRDDPAVVPQLASSHLSVKDGPDGNLLIDMWGEPYAVPQLCSYLLAAARENAERQLECPVRRAVVTVPVSFSNERVELLRRAARLAHIEIVQVVEEPAAAALANRNAEGFGGLIGVYDFGGGTFDFSVVDASGGDFRVLTTAGDSWLGGDDFDLAVADAAANLIWRAHGVDLRQRAVEWQYLLRSSEHAKQQLSSQSTADIRVPEAIRTERGIFDLRLRVKREQVEPLWHRAIQRSLATCSQTLALLGLSPPDLSAIYLSGGTSYIPAVRRALARQLGVPVRVGVPPEHAVVLGAGVLGAQLERALTPTLPAR